MKRSALSLYLFALYQITGVFLPFILFPETALGWFGLEAGDGLWVRLVGVLAGIMGTLYIVAVQHDLEIIYWWSVPARYATALFNLSAVVTGLASPALIGFALFDATAGSLTWLALRHEKREREALAASS